MVFGCFSIWAFGGKGSILPHKERRDKEEDIERNKFVLCKVESEPIIYPQDLPRDAVDFIEKLLKKDPEERIKNE